MKLCAVSKFFRNLHILQDSRDRLGGQVESWQGLWCWILMKLSQELLTDNPYHLTPTPGSSGITPGSSGISNSSKTPGRDLEDRWSLVRVSDVRSWWYFHRSFWSIIPIIWHHLQVHQEPPRPPRLKEETWRTVGVLTNDTTSRIIRNLHILQDSRERLWGQVESWQGFWC